MSRWHLSPIKLTPLLNLAAVCAEVLTAGDASGAMQPWLAFTSQSNNTARLLQQSADGTITEDSRPFLRDEFSLCVAEVAQGIVAQVCSQQVWYTVLVSVLTVLMSVTMLLPLVLCRLFTGQKNSECCPDAAAELVLMAIVIHRCHT
jgi:hypothetical protein